MRKRQIYMLLIAIWLAIIIPACRQGIQPTLYEDNPVIVDQPVSDRTVFTNWEEIKLTYTIRWLDGYEPLFDEAKPENMFFGPKDMTTSFELDPVRGYKLERQNRRKYKKENYEDLVYFLRYIGEKKGNVIIPEQTFKYIKIEPGKQKEGLETHDFKAPGIMLRYDSVLTENADDIIDRVDFGSFKRQEYLWDSAIGGTAIIMCVILVLFFRKPAIYTAGKIRKTKTAIGSQTIYEQEERLTPKYARVYLNNKLLRLQAELRGNFDTQKLHETKVTICNELWQFFLSYVPELKKGEFAPEKIKIRISQISKKREKELLIVLVNWLEEYDKILNEQKAEGNLLKNIEIIRNTVRDLDDWNIWFFNKRQGWLKLEKQLKRLLGGDR